MSKPKLLGRFAPNAAQTRQERRKEIEREVQAAMTYLEDYKIKNPPNIRMGADGLPISCPPDMRGCPKPLTAHGDPTCDDCWNREIPGKETAHD